MGTHDAEHRDARGQVRNRAMRAILPRDRIPQVGEIAGLTDRGGDHQEFLFAEPCDRQVGFDAGALPQADLPDDVSRLAQYGLDSAGSSVRTQEAGIHGARSAMDGGLLWLECSQPLLLTEPERRSALQAWAASLPLRGLQPLQFFCIDFAYTAR